jgi:predicted pyridoxine 5'-phosphate oxidase superfamily flavin-nucleotide-binding protein
MELHGDSTVSASPFHAGEREIQRRQNRRERVETMGRRVIRDYLPEQHREFYQGLPYALIGSLDGEGWPWASIVCGDPGFIDTPTTRSLRITTEALMGDPLAGNLAVGAPVGMLGIDLSKRRRNRLSATVSDSAPGSLALQVVQSFGNCPQYIQSRQVLDRSGHAPGPVEPLCELGDEHRAMVSASDTFFVASASSGAPDSEVCASQGVDVSHRGGRPGFVRVADDGLLTIPDYAGNNYFNTLGNILRYPRAGLLFVDFDSGDILSLTGEAAIEWDLPEARHFVGAERCWTFRPLRGVLLRRALPWRYGSATPSPQSPLTGTWEEALVPHFSTLESLQRAQPITGKRKR